MPTNLPAPTTRLESAMFSSMGVALQDPQEVNPDSAEWIISSAFETERCGPRGLFWTLWLDRCWMPEWCSEHRGCEWTSSLVLRTETKDKQPSSTISP